jgi:hypothetical protein
MISVLALSLLLPTSATRVPAAANDPDPPIHLKLSDDTYERGDHARVRVKTDRNGYLLVLRQDGDGRIRVVFPLSPDDSGAIRGGHEMEIRGRGDREAFSVDERDGSGMVLAAISDEPLRLQDFARGGHWDYRTLAPADSGEDPEANLLDLVERMTSGHYDYDLVTYTVIAHEPRRYSAGWYGPWYYGYYPWYYGPRFGFRLDFGLGRGRFFHGRRW